MRIKREVKHLACAISAITLCATTFISLAMLQTGKAEAKSPEPYDHEKLQSLCWGTDIAVSGDAVMCDSFQIATWYTDENGNKMMVIEDLLPKPPQTSAGNPEGDSTKWSDIIESCTREDKGDFGFDVNTSNAVCGNETAIIYDSPDNWPNGVSELVEVCQKTEGNNGSFTLHADGSVTCNGASNKIATWLDDFAFRTPLKLSYQLTTEQTPRPPIYGNDDDLYKWSDMIGLCVHNGGANNISYDIARDSLICNGYDYALAQYGPSWPQPEGFSQLVEVCQKTEGNDGGFTLHADKSVTCNGASNKIATWLDGSALDDKLEYQLISDSTSGNNTTPSSSEKPPVSETPSISETPSTNPDTSTDGTTSSSETRQLINQLQTLISQIKSDPIFQHYQKLIEAVKAAEELLAKTSNSTTTSRTTAPERKPDQPYTAYTTTARLANTVIAASNQQDLTDAIKAIGNALRELGIKTDLGQTTKTPTIEDLQAAIKAAKRVEKYSEYASLVKTLETAELAISNGTVSTATLANLQNALASTKNSNSTISAPDTGTNKQNSTAAQANSSASTTVKVLVVTSIALIVIGVSIIVYRQITRKEA